MKQYIKLTGSDYKKMYRRKRIKNKFRYKKHLQFLAEGCTSFTTPAFPVDKYGNYVDMKNNSEELAYYKRLHRSNHKNGVNQYCKKCLNKAVRNYTGDLLNNCSYKKCFEYWYIIC